MFLNEENCPKNGTLLYLGEAAMPCKGSNLIPKDVNIHSCTITSMLSASFQNSEHVAGV